MVGGTFNLHLHLPTLPLITQKTQKWCIFPQSTQDAFLSTFLHSTSSSQDRTSTPTATKPRSTTPIAAPAAKSKWKTVDTKPEAFNPSSAIAAVTEDEDVDGVPMADDDDNDVDGEPMVDEDVDGEPMVEDMEVEEAPEGEEMRGDEEEVADEGLMEIFGVGVENEVEEKAGLGMGMTGFRMGGGSARGGGSTRGGSTRGRGDAASASGGGQRKRMRAEDMFADDDDED